MRPFCIHLCGSGARATMLRTSLGVSVLTILSNVGYRADAAVFIVNTTVDSQDTNPGDGIAADVNGNTSLRAAIMEANAQAGPHDIFLPAGTFILSLTGSNDNQAFTGDLDIHAPLRIVGMGSTQTVIDASPCPVPPCPDHDRAFDIFAPDVFIEQLAIRRAWAPVGQMGGAVRRQSGGLVRFVGVEIAQCVADSGGAVYSTGGQLEFHFSQVQQCGSHLDGGGIFLASHGMLAIGTEFQFNHSSLEAGGAIATLNGTNLVLEQCLLLGNQAERAGGAVLVGGSADADFINTTFLENTAALGGAVRTGGTTHFSGCSLIGNTAVGPPQGLAVGTAGGAIYTFGTLTQIRDTTIAFNTVDSGLPEDSGGGLAVSEIGTVEVINTTIHDNTASNTSGQGRGGGIANLGQLRVINSTISGNESRNHGGGLYTYPIGSVHLSHVTIAENHAENAGGGIFHGGSIVNLNLIGTILSRNTIIVNPGPPPLIGPQNCAFVGLGLTSSGYNLDDDGTANLSGPGDLNNVPAGILPLANNGGLTWTHALMPNSRARDGAVICTDVAGNIVVSDQRGVQRPQGAACDIGAFEFVPTGPANDDCVNPFLAGPGFFPYDNTGATTDGPADGCFSGLPGMDSDIWFFYQAPCHGLTNISLIGGNFDRVLSIYENACPQAGGTLFTCAISPAGQNLGFTVPHGPGKILMIRVGGVNGQQGMGNLEITVLCTCPADVFPAPAGDSLVNVNDLLQVINNWGPCAQPCPPYCPVDITDDCTINVNDLLAVINSWGACP